MQALTVTMNGCCVLFTVPSPFRFNGDTQHKKSRSGAHPNQMKQSRMILKAQKVYFALGTSTVNKYDDGMTNSGQQYGTHKAGCPWHPCHVAARCSSCQLRICSQLWCGVQSRPPGRSESSSFASFGSDGHLNDAKL